MTYQDFRVFLRPSWRKNGLPLESLSSKLFALLLLQPSVPIYHSNINHVWLFSRHRNGGLMVKVPNILLCRLIYYFILLSMALSFPWNYGINIWEDHYYRKNYTGKVCPQENIQPWIWAPFFHNNGYDSRGMQKANITLNILGDNTGRFYWYRTPRILGIGRNTSRVVKRWLFKEWTNHTHCVDSLYLLIISL